MDLSAVKGEATFEYRPFLWLFADAIYYSDLAGKEPSESFHRAAHARTSLLMSVYAVEGAINSALFSHKYSKRLQNRIERFPFGEKTEFIASAFGCTKSFEPKSDYVLDMDELLELRNGQVHPRNKFQQLVGDISATGKHEFKKTKEEHSLRLRIPLNSSEWDQKTATMALRVADTFLDQFFVVTCSLKKEALRDVFSSMLVGKGWTAHVHEKHGEDQLRNAKERLKLSLSYLAYPLANSSRT